MKLRKSKEPETIAPLPGVEPLMPDLEASVAGASGASKMGAIVALVGSLLAIALVGATTWLIYQNLTLLEGV